jgi:hypothetical protein
VSKLLAAPFFLTRTFLERQLEPGGEGRSGKRGTFTIDVVAPKYGLIELFAPVCAFQRLKWLQIWK